MYCRMLALASHGLSGPASSDIGPVHTACIGVSVGRREFLNQWATPTYRRTHVGQQFVEMFEMVGSDA